MSGAEAEGSDKLVEDVPRRSREEILRDFKLALTIGDGSLLETDQDRGRGVNPYDNPLGRRPAGGPLGGHGTLGGHNSFDRIDWRGLPGDSKPRRRR